MGLKVLILATLSSLVINVNAISVPSNEFTDNFQDVCYSRTDDFSKPLPLIITKWNNDRSSIRRTNRNDETFKDGPISMSVESLISLIEKIEAHQPKIDAKELATILLRKYRTDDLEYGSLGLFTTPENMKTQYKIENAVLGIDESSIDISKVDRILDMDENCTLHFLLSHNIDIVAKRGDKSSSPFRVQSQPQGQPPQSTNGRTEFRPRYSVASLPKNSQITKMPREYGVGTFRQNVEQAILLNKLLLGVIAGLSDNRRVTVAELYSSIRRDQPLSGDIKLNVQSDMDPLMAVTLAATLSYGAYTDEQIYQNLFGATGKWNSTLCAVEFDIDVSKDIEDIKDIPGVAATMAEIRGAIDAYSIGKALRQLRESNGNSKSKGELKLSQILRLFYSPLGFLPSTSEYSYCSRPNFRIDTTDITRDAQAYKRLSILVSQGIVKVEDILATGPIDKVKQEFFSKMELARRIPDDDRDWCDDKERTIDKMDKAICETRSDVFVLIDHTQDTEKMEKQFEIIDKLAQNLDIRRFGSSLSILALAENSSHPKSLHRIAWEDTNKGCATCQLAFADRSDLPSTFDVQDLPTYINGTLCHFELERQYETSVPSRTFIIFNFGSLEAGRVNTYRFNQAKSLLNTYHRNTRILVVSDKNNYDYLIENKEKDFFLTESTNADVQMLTKKLLNRICETPAVFQHPECHLRPSQTSQYTGYLTPGHVQNWAMYPQFFYKSFNIEFIFKAERGKLRVCHAKTERPGFENQNGVCYENRDNEEIKFNRENPCYKFTRESCAPFYFTIYGIDESAVNPLCKEEQCSNMKQIQFTFTHTGISCNKASGIAFSPVLVIVTILAAITVHKQKNQFF